MLGKPTNDILNKAIDDLKVATKLDPTSKTSQNSLGDAYLLKGLYQEAIKSFSAAIERDSTYAAPYSGICSAYALMGDRSRAENYARLAASHDADLRQKKCLTEPI